MKSWRFPLEINPWSFSTNEKHHCFVGKAYTRTLFVHFRTSMCSIQYSDHRKLTGKHFLCFVIYNYLVSAIYVNLRLLSAKNVSNNLIFPTLVSNAHCSMVLHLFSYNFYAGAQDSPAMGRELHIQNYGSRTVETCLTITGRGKADSSAFLFF